MVDDLDDIYVPEEWSTTPTEEVNINTPVNNDSPVEDILAEDVPTLTDLIALGDPTVDIYKGVVNRYSEDPKFAVVLKNPASYKNFEVSNGLVFLKDNGKHVLCIPDIKINGRRV